MTEPTDAEIRLAFAFLRMVREARKPLPDDRAGAYFGKLFLTVLAASRPWLNYCRPFAKGMNCRTFSPPLIY